MAAWMEIRDEETTRAEHRALIDARLSGLQLAREMR
jgi:hypothetical protein